MKGEILHETYQIKAQLSKRGGRETLLAQDLNTKQIVIIKLLKFGLDSEWEDFKLFEREAQTLKNLDHSAIPNYLDYFELDLPRCQGFALVQEYIDAPSLEASLKAGRSFSELEIEQIAEALLNILQHLHQRQPSIIHRDIKPSNILLTNRSGNSVGQVYLVDFGAVKNIAAQEGGTITVVGTYGYMPPEQFGGKTTPASDLYSLGATLIYLATGAHPTELPSKDGRILFEEQVSLSPALKNWLRKLIEPNCDRRFCSAAEALQALKHPIALKKETEIIKQPAFSKIVLRQTAAEITVFIPPKGFTLGLIWLVSFAIAWNSFLIFWTGFAVFMAPFPINLMFALFSIPFWTAGLAMILAIIFTLFGTTKLQINPKQISLIYECLGIKYQKPKPTSRQNITAIERTPSGWKIKNNDDNSTASSVVIWADGQAYKLSSAVHDKNNFSVDTLSNIELDWLAQELSQWLNMPLTQRKF